MLKRNVLRKKSDFSAIYNKGKSIGDRYVVLFYRKNGLPYHRTGFLASKKVGNSVVRHRFARLVRESFRLNKDILEEGKDIIVVARAAAKDKNFDKIESAFLHLCGLHNILKESK